MVSRVLRTKAAKLITVLLVLTVVIIASLIYKNHLERKRYEEQTVMAELYLKEGNFTQAVEAYKKALSMKNIDKERLSIGLAESYIGINDYDKALEVLRICYQNAMGSMIKEKIEEVTIRKNDFEFQSFISRGDKYFANQEYDKAIIEFEKAKRVKSKEFISYQRIAEAYMENGQYNKAHEEILDGLALTQSDELNKKLEEVDLLLLKVQYEEIINQASEYIYQENYAEAIKKYMEAITLLPSEEVGYFGLAETYIIMEKYDSAIMLLQSALKRVNSNNLVELSDKAITLSKNKEESQRMIKQIYNSAKQGDVQKLKSILMDPFVAEHIAVKTPIYYDPKGEGDVSMDNGLLINDRKTIYYGSLREGIKSGTGLYFLLRDSKDDQIFYYYSGEWENNEPNGIGETGEEIVSLDENGIKNVTTTITRGSFLNGLENGKMVKYFYRNEKEIDKITYIAQNGIPVPLLDKKGERIIKDNTGDYAIGKLYIGDEITEEYYYVNKNSLWGFVN